MRILALTLLLVTGAVADSIVVTREFGVEILPSDSLIVTREHYEMVRKENKKLNLPEFDLMKTVAFYILHNASEGKESNIDNLIFDGEV